MKINGMINVYFYTRYERFWHWLQMALIIILLVTGFDIQGYYTLSDFKLAVNIHNYVGIGWLLSFTFFIFWIFTTGEWKQYIPTTKKMFAVMLYYVYGIFTGGSHPVKKHKQSKHNPLQRIVYLSIVAFLLPVQMMTGSLYWSYNSWDILGFDFLSLQSIAFIHTAGAFSILSFIIVHVYMTTTGHTIFAHIKAMITGWEYVSKDDIIEDWEKAKH